MPKMLLERTAPTERIDEALLTKHVRADILPTEGYSMEVDGKLKKQFSSPESAVEAGIALKRQFPNVQVRIYDGKERTRTPVDLPIT